MTILKDLIFPVIVATLTTNLWNWWYVLHEAKKTKYEKLYAPLRFYLMRMKVNDEVKSEIIGGLRTTSKEWKEGKTSYDQGQIQIDINDKMSKMLSPRTNEWWMDLEKIKGIVESNPQHIKPYHFDLFSNFISAYIKRGVVGKNLSGDEAAYLPEDKANEYTTSLLDAVKRLQSEFL